MTPTPHSRRDVLKGAVAITAAASVGIGRADAQESAMQARTRIDGVLKQAVDAKEVPGVVAMAATDKGVLYEGAFGTRDLAKGPAMTLDTVFRIASMTKAVTCTAAMQLVEQGRLKIDEPVPSIDPALSAPQVLEGFDAAGAPKLRPAKRPITIRHLLTHTSGLAYAFSNPRVSAIVQKTGKSDTDLPLQFGDHLCIARNLFYRDKRMDFIKLRPAQRHHFRGGIQFHGAGTQRNHAVVQRQIFVFQQRDIAEHRCF